MKREDLEAKEFGLIIASRNFPFYAASEADAVMDGLEERIKELEVYNENLKIDKDHLIVMNEWRIARIKALEAKLKENDEVMDSCRGLIESANAMSKSAKDKLLNRIKELEKRLEDVQNTMATENVDLGMENFKLKERIKELETTVPKWISVKDRLPNIGEIVLVYFDERVKSHYFPIDIVRWDSSYELQEISVTHWQPLPSSPTTEKERECQKVQ